LIRTPTERAGFTLIELLLALALLGILLGLGIVSLSPLVAQSHLDTATSCLQSALEEAQIRALRNLRSYRVQLEQQEVWLESKQSSRWQAEQLWEVLPEGVSVTATRWPSFSASGFAVGGTLDPTVGGLDTPSTSQSGWSNLSALSHFLKESLCLPLGCAPPGLQHLGELINSWQLSEGKTKSLEVTGSLQGNTELRIL